MSYGIRKVGAEIEFSAQEEGLLGSFLALYNAKKGFSVNRLYKENSIIYEYRCPVIRAGHYRNFMIFYYMVSKLSNAYYVEGYNDDASGSFHCHLEIWKDGEKIRRADDLPCDITEEDFCNEFSSFLQRSNQGWRASLDDLFTVDNSFSFCDMPWDSKSHGVTWNTGHDTVEIRANENIPAWYILVEDYLNNYDYKLQKTDNKYYNILVEYLQGCLRNKNVHYGLNYFAHVVDSITKEFKQLWVSRLQSWKEDCDLIKRAYYQTQEKNWEDVDISSSVMEEIINKIKEEI